MPVNDFGQMHLKLLDWLSQTPSFKHESSWQKFLTSLDVVLKIALALVLLVVVGGVGVVFVLLEVVGINIAGELRVVVGAVDSLLTKLPLNFGSLNIFCEINSVKKSFMFRD